MPQNFCIKVKIFHRLRRQLIIFLQKVEFPIMECPIINTGNEWRLCFYTAGDEKPYRIHRIISTKRYFKFFTLHRFILDVNQRFLTH